VHARRGRDCARRAALSLWAIFERAAFEPLGVPEPIVPDDPDLVAAACLFGLAI